MARASGPAARGRRGRPPRLSRDAILEAGLALLEREPRRPLTLGRVADEVGAVPAALYRHVGSHDALVDGVLGLVLGGIRLELRLRAPWPAQLRDWMRSLRAHLLRYPAVLPMIGRRGRTSPAWLEVAAALARILGRSGLRGAALARAHLWVIEATTGFVMQEASVPLREQIGAARAALGEMGEAGRRQLAPLLRELAAIDADAHFDFVVERTLAGLAELVARTSPPREPASAGRPRTRGAPGPRGGPLRRPHR
jgi:AcrR family transcriptional regulator